MRITTNTQSALVFIFVSLWQTAFASDANTGPSFDCSRAATKIEKAICADILLSLDDRRLSKLYQAKKAIPALEEKLKTSQIEWLRTERAQCENPEQVDEEDISATRTACLKAAYKNRIEAIYLLKATPEDAQGKPPVKFKLMTGASYPLCRDYVVMLNQSEYIDAPVCERKILPGFSKFRAIKWTEISDKKQIKNVLREYMMMEGLWMTGGQARAESRWEITRSRIDAGEWPELDQARIDMDHDGHADTVHRFTLLRPELEKYGSCTERKEYFIKFDEAEKTEASYSRKPYTAQFLHFGGLGSGTKGLFYYDGRAFQDYWTSWGAQYQIKVNEISGIPNQVCGINIIQRQGENNDLR